MMRLRNVVQGLKKSYSILGKVRRWVALQTPDGRNPQARSVWLIDDGRRYSRLISAYARD
jgi:hypothetical protein